MEDTREIIIDEAYKLFLNKSYEAVSIKDISTAIGFTKGALYHHFLNKEELFKAVIDKYLKITGLDQSYENATLAELFDGIENYAEGFIRNAFIEDKPFVPVNHLSLFIDACRHYPSYSEDYEDIFGTEIKKMELVLKNAIKSGEIRKDIDVSMTALNMLSISIGIVANLFRKNSPTSSIEIFRSQMKEFYKMLLPA